MAITINAGRTFLICEDSGDITREEQGLYCSDTRWLNKYILTINGERPGVLLGGSPEYFSSVHYLTTKPEREKREIEAGSISIVRRREVNDGLRESIDISNFDSTACSLELRLEFDSDFADIFELKAGRLPSEKLVVWRSADGGAILSQTEASITRECKINLSIRSLRVKAPKSGKCPE